MKLAWLCYGYYFGDDDDPIDQDPKIVFFEPEGYRYQKVVPIVYAEIESNE